MKHRTNRSCKTKFKKFCLNVPVMYQYVHVFYRLLIRKEYLFGRRNPFLPLIPDFLAGLDLVFLDASIGFPHSNT